MINKSYKIWIILFISINIILLVWSLGYLDFLEKKLTSKKDIIVIEPDTIFEKKLPPKDESFPNEKSKLWKAFEDKDKIEKKLQNDIVEENTLEKNNDKSATDLELVNDLKNGNNQLEGDKSIDLKSTDTSKKDEKDKEKISKNQLVAEDVKTEKKIKNNIKTDFFYVQVASLSKKNLVEKEWNRFKKRHFEYVDNLIYVSQKAELNDNKIFYRILVGKFSSKKDAKNFCNNINFSNCILKKINE